MKNLIKSEEIEKIKKELPRVGSYKLISGMINGAYKPNTIKAMINQQRTMNPGVFQAAKSVIELMKSGENMPSEISGYNRQVSVSIIINPTNTNGNESNE